MQRTSVYWDQVLAPALRAGKTLLVVGHENNLRSIIMRLEGISPNDIINLSLPRAVPLAYRLDENLRPINLRPDGSLDEATGFVRGEWLGGDQAVAEILDRDHKQVYDVRITQNLEKFAVNQNDWDAVLPEAKAKAGGADVMVGMSAVTCSLVDPENILAAEVPPLLAPSPPTLSSVSSRSTLMHTSSAAPATRVPPSTTSSTRRQLVAA